MTSQRTITWILVLGTVLLAAAQIGFSMGPEVSAAYPLIMIVLAANLLRNIDRVADRREQPELWTGDEGLEVAVQRRTQDLRTTQLEIVRRLGQAAEWRDGNTGAHLERIGILCQQLGLRCGLSDLQADKLRHAALLHDVGKIGIPDSILLKEGPLNDEQWMIMRGHTTIGAEILADSSAEMIQLAEVVARTHHERWDGSGYPEGLAGENIPIEGRICAICDVFDALLSTRPYKDSWTITQTLNALREGSGSHFDPTTLASFLEIAPELGARLYADSSGILAKH